MAVYRDVNTGYTPPMAGDDLVGIPTMDAQGMPVDPVQVPDRLYREPEPSEEMVPELLDVETKEFGDILVLFKRPSEMWMGSKYWMETLGVLMQSALACQDFGHCELHFVQSDVGIASGVDANGVIFMWNKGYDRDAYELVYRVKLKSARYNRLLEWATDLAREHPGYDKVYMYRYCWLCWCRRAIPVSFSDTRRDVYTCASLCYSLLAEAGLSDLPASPVDRKARYERYSEMKRERNALVWDVRDLLEGAATGRYDKSSDVVSVVMLREVPYALQFTPSKSI